MGKHILLTTEKHELRMTLIQKLRYILIMKKIRKMNFKAKEASLAFSIASMGLIKSIRESVKACNEFSKECSKLNFKPSIRVRFKSRRKRKNGSV